MKFRLVSFCFTLASFFLGILVGNILFPVGAQAPAKYQANELQTLKLQNAQKDLQLALVGRDQAQQNVANKVAALNELAGEVKKENKWPDKVGFDMAHVSFCDNLGKDGLCPPDQPPAAAPADPPKTPPAAEKKP